MEKNICKRISLNCEEKLKYFRCFFKEINKISFKSNMILLATFVKSIKLNNNLAFVHFYIIFLSPRGNIK